MSSSTAPRRGYHHGDLRAGLIREGIALLAETGVAGFSVAKVAARAGVSSAAPYRHFPDREALLAACAAAIIAEVTDVLAAAAEQAGDDPVDRLAATAGAYARYVLDHRAGIDLVYFHDLSGPYHEVVQEESRRLTSALMDLVAAVLPEDTSWADTVEFVYVHLSMTHGYATLLRQSTPKDAEAYAARAAAAARDHITGHLMRLHGSTP
ncbi:DNA-binding transcriptional regulator, AcrR family [Nonomuraea solani]|uniref:DNA-binding transcriptional regulator, AcrR family n=1 Tax=Nonomuraea solani TaxID=1144553 RepID=A0A1H6DRC6_9ACTN|nr:TetR/AcrR family transcriptional regulator [Nonomuraea solani]SEG87780.1 DNA-binding transcriptional regulator, AcrR family [Nonomuraea solani]